MAAPRRRKLDTYSTEDLQALIKRCGSSRAAAKELGVPGRTLRHEMKLRKTGVYKQYNPNDIENPAELEVHDLEVAPDGESAAVAQKVTGWRGVETLDELEERCQIDTEEWAREWQNVRAWPLLLGEGRIEQGVYVRATYKRKGFDDPERMAKRWLDIIKSRSRKVKPLRVAASKNRGLMVGLFDLHFGKQACWNERGERWTVDECYAASMGALEEMVEYAKAGRVSRIWFPIGNDFLHVDNLQGTTTRGTPGFPSHHLHELQRVGEEFLVKAAQQLARVAPVEVVTIQGNHDKVQTLHMGAFLDAWFRRNSNVTVDRTPTPRKYRRHGRVCIGWSHYQLEVKKEVHAMFLREANAAGVLEGTCFHEFFTGHIHKMETEEVQGVRVRRCPSLSPTDNWHLEKGYHNQRAADAYLICPDRGTIGTHSFTLPTFDPKG